MRYPLYLLTLVLLAAPVHGRPAYKKALADLLALPAVSRLNDCATCHLPGKEDDRPHNAFGARLAAARSEFRKAGKPHDITARILALGGEDSDGDGVANLLELLAGTSPGDAADRPSAEAIAKAQVRKASLLAAQTEYRWRPFDRVERPALPATSAQHPIDRFLAVEQERRGVTPRPEAPRAVLLRRVTLDLTGVPPTPDELHAFLQDERPDAYERVVDRLLASPRHGERWGRHWMDVWRYSDWAGFGAQVRDSQPHIWHWRDWIVESLNEDRSYDRMVQEMLAADELAPLDRSALRATGYLVRNYKLLSREKWLQDTVDHTGMAFLGLTLGCAKCHDHMYDPITMREYYQVRAIFMPHNVRTDRLPGHPDPTKLGLPRAYDADPAAKTFLLLRGDDRNPDKTPLEPGVPESLGGPLAVTPVALPKFAQVPDRQPFVLTELISGFEAAQKIHDRDVNQATWLAQMAPVSVALQSHPLRALVQAGQMHWKELRAESARMHREEGAEVLAKHRLLVEVERLEDAGQASGPAWEKAARAVKASERQLAYLQARNRHFVLRHGLNPPETNKKLNRSQQIAEAEKAEAKAKAELQQPPATTYTPRTVKTYPATSTGRRLAFARWLTSRDNPLAARVAVNHLWLRHFGRGIVPSAFDFGRNAEPPSYPALLDWLAAEFMESGWSMKHLHRLVVTSAAYRRASTPTAANLTHDPDNISLWRFAPRRLEAEVVRDALWFVGAGLDGTLGGPDLPHEQGLAMPRRSLYFQHAQEKQMEFLQIFDVASVTECYARKQAILPQQALALGNNEWVLAQARQVAQQVIGADSVFVRSGFERILGRAPTSEESAACLEFLRERGGTPRAREMLALVLLNHHEFVTLH
ncbi:MAG: DUF1549 and DUF1553 domain-containing protein [Gemmataceae bacterium]